MLYADAVVAVAVAGVGVGVEGVGAVEVAAGVGDDAAGAKFRGPRMKDKSGKSRSVQVSDVFLIGR